VSTMDLVVRAARSVTPDGISGCEIGIHDGRIVAVERLGAGLTGTEVRELGVDEVLLPGLVDTHVHVNDPGRTEWEGFDSASGQAQDRAGQRARRCRLLGRSRAGQPG
jgi:allantoinase